MQVQWSPHEHRCRCFYHLSHEEIKPESVLGSMFCTVCNQIATQAITYPLHAFDSMILMYALSHSVFRACIRSQSSTVIVYIAWTIHTVQGNKSRKFTGNTTLWRSRTRGSSSICSILFLSLCLNDIFKICGWNFSSVDSSVSDYLAEITPHVASPSRFMVPCLTLFSFLRILRGVVDL